jgi:hypothetical protein
MKYFCSIAIVSVLSALAGCTEIPSKTDSLVRVTCMGGNTCEGTPEECVLECSESAIASEVTVSDEADSTDTPADVVAPVTVHCCGTVCEGQPLDCATFCRAMC